MHATIDGAGRQGFFYFLGEQGFTADLGQRPIAHAVTGGGDFDNLDGVRGGQRRDPLAQAIGHHLGLGQGQDRASRANPEGRASGVFALLIHGWSV